MNLQSHAHKFIGLTDINQIKTMLREIGLSALNEIRDLPNTVEPDWLKKLVADDHK